MWVYFSRFIEEVQKQMVKSFYRVMKCHQASYLSFLSSSVCRFRLHVHKIIAAFLGITYTFWAKGKRQKLRCQINQSLLKHPKNSQKFSTSELYTKSVHACMLSHVQLLGPHGLQPSRPLCPWDTGVGCHFLLQGIFLTEESNPCLLLLSLYHWGACVPKHLP